MEEKERGEGGKRGVKVKDGVRERGEDVREGVREREEG